MNEFTLYDVLDVDKTASADAIKRSYRKLSKEYHPDRNAHRSEDERAACAAHYQRVQEAWDTLGDPARRAAYDVTGRPQSKLDPEQELTSVLMGPFISSFREALTNERDVTKINFVEKMRSVLTNQMRQMEAALADSNRRGRELERAIGRFTVAGSSENLFNRVLEGQLRDVREHSAKIKIDLDMVQRGLNYLKDAKYRIDSSTGGYGIPEWALPPGQSYLLPPATPPEVE